jgi:CBS domain containing-hemolysin-like protein
VARIVAAPMRAFTVALRPIIAVCNGLANAVVRALGVEPQEELRSARSATELGSLVRASAEQGTLPGATATLMARSLDFAERVAGEVMTPRTRLVSLAESASADEVLAVARRSGHSRFPVLPLRDGQPDLDAIDGYVSVKAALGVPAALRRSTSAAALIRPLLRVPESMRLAPLLSALRAHHAHLAVVVDEYGGTAGLISLEDVVEELVGEVDDEHDPFSPLHRAGAEGGLEVAGILRLDEVGAVADGFHPAAGPYDTLGGLIMARLGRLAVPGDEITESGWTITVTDVERHRIATVLLRRQR